MDPDPDEDGQLDAALGDAIPELGAAAMAAAAVMALPGPAGIVAGALVPPVMSRALKLLDVQFFRQRVASAESVLQEAADLAGTDPDGFVGLLSDPERLQLAGMAVAAGAQTVLDDKIQALGRALATGVLAEDQAVIDDQRLIVAALASMEAPHVRILRVIAEEWPPRMPRWSDQPRWMPADVAEALGDAQDPGTIAAILTALEGAHLIQREDVTKKTFDAYSKARGRAIAGGSSSSASFRVPTAAWSVTDFGRRVLELLRDIGVEEADEEET